MNELLYVEILCVMWFYKSIIQFIFLEEEGANILNSISKNAFFINFGYLNNACQRLWYLLANYVNDCPLRLKLEAVIQTEDDFVEHI